MRIAVLSALHAELQRLVDGSSSLRRVDIGDWALWVGLLNGQDVILARAGLGKVNTAALAGVIWERYHPETIVFTGVAGGLDPSLEIGDIVVAERAIQHDWGVLAPDGLQRYQAGHFPFYNPTDQYGFTPSASLLDTIRGLATEIRLTPVLDREPTIEFGTILTGDQFLQDPGARDRLFAELGAQAIEMEGAALGQAAARFGVDHLVIRAISDLASGEAVEHFDRFVPLVAANSAHLVLELLERI